MIATPMTLMALLKAVAFGWRQERFTKNAREIRKLGEELYDRIQTLGAHVTKLGRGIKASGDAYDKMVGSLETRVLPSVRKFRDLGATAKDEIPLLESASIEPRKLTSSELSEPEESQEIS